MGMTDKQFVSFRREQLEHFENMLKLAKETNADPELVRAIQKEVEKAKSDIEA